MFHTLFKGKVKTLSSRKPTLTIETSTDAFIAEVLPFSAQFEGDLHCYPKIWDQTINS